MPLLPCEHGGNWVRAQRKMGREKLLTLSETMQRIKLPFLFLLVFIFGFLQVGKVKVCMKSYGGCVQGL